MIEDHSKTIYIFDDISVGNCIEDCCQKHLLSDVTPLLEEDLKKYDRWVCSIDTWEYASLIGVIYALAAKWNKKIIFQESKILSPAYWKDITHSSRISI